MGGEIQAVGQVVGEGVEAGQGDGSGAFAGAAQQAIIQDGSYRVIAGCEHMVDRDVAIGVHLKSIRSIAQEDVAAAEGHVLPGGGQTVGGQTDAIAGVVIRGEVVQRNCTVAVSFQTVIPQVIQEGVVAGQGDAAVRALSPLVIQVGAVQAVPTGVHGISLDGSQGSCPESILIISVECIDAGQGDAFNESR